MTSILRRLEQKVSTKARHVRTLVYFVSARKRLDFFEYLLSIPSVVPVQYLRRINFLSLGLFNYVYSQLVSIFFSGQFLPSNSLWTDGFSMLNFSVPAKPNLDDLTGSLRGASYSRYTWKQLLCESGCPDRNFDFYPADLVGSRDIALIITSPLLHQSISAQLSLPYFISQVSAWATFSGTSNLNQNAMQWHIDYDRCLEVKVFILLEECDLSCGFQYCRSSHLPPLLIDDGGIESLPQIYRTTRTPVSLFGNCGTSFITLNWGVHRDAPPPKGGLGKIVLQLQLAVDPFSIFGHSSSVRYKPTPGSEAHGLFVKAKSSLPFIFRMFDV